MARKPKKSEQPPVLGTIFVVIRKKDGKMIAASHKRGYCLGDAEEVLYRATPTGPVTNLRTERQRAKAGVELETVTVYR